MSRLYRFICECADSHAEHGDSAGARAIMFAAEHGVNAARLKYPKHVAAIDNAILYARQETGPVAGRVSA